MAEKSVRAEPKFEPLTTSERIAYYAPKAGKNDEQNLFVSVNGKNTLIPKGKTSALSPDVYEEIRRSERAKAHLDAVIDAKLKEGNK